MDSEEQEKKREGEGEDYKRIRDERKDKYQKMKRIEGGDNSKQKMAGERGGCLPHSYLKKIELFYFYKAINSNVLSPWLNKHYPIYVLCMCVYQ